MFRIRTASAGLRYGLAVFFSVLAAVFKLLLAPLIVPSAFVTAYAAVFASALVGGLGPGLIATALSVAVDAYLFQPLSDPLTPARIGMFVVLAAATCWMATKVRTSEQRAAEAERRYRRLFDSDLLGILFWNMDGRITEANDRLLEMLGYTRAEFMAATVRWTDITPAEYAHLDAQALEQIRATGVSPPFEKECVRKDGSRMPIVMGGASFERGAEDGVAFILDITQRIQAEAALRAANVELERRVTERTAALQVSEERHRLVSELTSDFAYWMRIEPGGHGAFEWVSGAFHRVTGLAPEEIGVAGFLSLVHPDDTPRVLERVRLLLSGEPAVTEYRLALPNGDVRWLRDYSRPVWDEQQHRVVRIIGAAQDITEGKRAEIALRESEERFQNAFRETANGMALVGLDGVPFQVNRALCDLLGYTEEELLTLSADALTHPDDLPAERAYVQRLLAGEIRSCQFEKRYVHKRGHVVWASLAASLVRGIDGRPLHYVSQVEDVTERHHLYEQLRASEERFALAVAAANDGIWDWDLRTDALYFSPQCRRILGRGNEDTPLVRSAWLSLLHPDDRDQASADLTLILSGQIDHYERELRLQQRDGTCRWLLTRGLVVRGPDGIPFRMVGSLTDVTERTQVSNILAALNAHLDVAAAFSSVAAGLRALAHCDRTSVLLFDEPHVWATVLALDQPREFSRPGTRVRMADSPVVPDILAGRPHVVPDLTPELTSPIVQQLYQDGVRSVLILPLLGTDRVSGMLTLAWHAIGACNDAPLPVLQQIANAVALALEKSRLFEQVRVGHERLQLLSRQLMRVQEAERRHLASELHDEIGQGLTGVKLMLDTFERSPALLASARLAEIQTLVNNLVTQIRNLSLDLRPAMLDDLGLLPALLWLFRRYSKQTKVEVVFEHRGLDRRFTPEAETAAFRIIQEALTNVARHAAVAGVQVAAIATDAELIVEITDDGQGFDPGSERAAGTGAGIAGMHERASLLGGHVSIESAPGAGTCLRAQLPLPRLRVDDELHGLPR